MLWTHPKRYCDSDPGLLRLRRFQLSVLLRRGYKKALSDLFMIFVISDGSSMLYSESASIRSDRIALGTTLDALPPQLVTPFNGPIPPSNLLDKIARGVAQAKGPVDWPHSLRATRVKLIELSRARAKEENPSRPGGFSDVDVDDPRYPDATPKIPRKRRPLYKRSSMDFMSNAELGEHQGIELVTDRLQQSERLIPQSNFHPYAVPVSRTRLASPACIPRCSSRTGTSTPSSSTLNTLSSFSANRILRRTSSNISTTSASSISINSGLSCTDPRVQRVRRSESIYNPPKDIRLPPSTHKENLESSPLAGAKRAPSFGAVAQEARRDRHLVGGVSSAHDNKDPLVYPSSDEEEKIRAKGAKKMRVNDTARLAPAVSGTTATPNTVAPKKTRPKVSATAPSCLPCKSLVPTTSPKSPPSKTKKSRSIPRENTSTLSGNIETISSSSAARKPRAAPMSLQRNPSIFGAELPPLASESRPRTQQASPSPAPAGALFSDKIVSPVPETPQRPKTLRRVQRVTLGRRISFGSLNVPGEDADAEGDDEDVNGTRRERRRQRDFGELGSAFQLR
ncbi:hypothetical protein C0995_000081 [Termitomyces sp. Mi166|nr:hypothetical protein C0995_000081 [Termitomyces sp. Mi166\